MNMSSIGCYRICDGNIQNKDFQWNIGHEEFSKIYWGIDKKFNKPAERENITIHEVRIRNGWASVLKTYVSREMNESSEKINKRYFNVSAMKKLCWTSSWETDAE